MEKLTDNDIWEWFYSHDNEWQNDVIEDANCGDNDELLIYLRYHYFNDYKED